MAHEDDMKATLKISSIVKKDKIEEADIKHVYKEAMFLYGENQKLRRRTNIAYLITAIAVVSSVFVIF